MSYQIKEVKLSTGGYSQEHIIEVKGTSDGGTAFHETVKQVVGYLQIYRYYVHINGYTIDVIKGVSSAGNDYIRTKPDSTTSDNLLSLPRF